jgi:hypothetical protein
LILYFAIAFSIPSLSIIRIALLDSFSLILVKVPAILPGTKKVLVWRLGLKVRFTLRFECDTLLPATVRFLVMLQILAMLLPFLS